jgi:hypothetical protein
MNKNKLEELRELELEKILDKHKITQKRDIYKKYLKKGLNVEQIDLITKYDFNDYQINEIISGLRNGLTIEQVELYAKPEFNDSQMEEIRWGFEKGLSTEQIKIYAKPNFNEFQMLQIRVGFENGLSTEQIKLYAKPDFNKYQMKEIKEGFEHGLSTEQVRLYAKSEFNADQMLQIRMGFEDGLSTEQVKLYAKSEFNEFQMLQIRVGFENGLSIEQVRLYAKPDFDWKQIKRIREALQKGLTYEQFNFIQKYKKEKKYLEKFFLVKYNNIEMFNKLFKNKIKNLEDYRNIFNLVNWELKKSLQQFLNDLKNRGYTEEQIDTYFQILYDLQNNKNMELSDNDKDIVLKGIMYDLKMFKNLIIKTENQKLLKEIFTGIGNGLELKQILLYANLNLDISSIRAIRKQIEKHKDLSADQLYVFIQYNFNENLIDKEVLQNIHIINKNNKKILICKDKEIKDKLPKNIKEKLQINDILIKTDKQKIENDLTEKRKKGKNFKREI